MTRRLLKPDSPWLLALLASLTALGPLSVDMYLPAMPVMMLALDTRLGLMQLTLSSYLAGFAIFHLFCGPLADRFGRKPVLLAGTALFILACVGCSLASTVEQLLLFRLLQGIGACVGPTLARTVVRDVFGPNRAARALSLIAMLMALAPAIAPGLGSLMLLVLPWRSIFVFLSVYGILISILIHYYLPESLPQRQSLHPLSISRNYGSLLASPSFVAIALGSSMIYAGMMVYIASSGFVYLEMLGLPLKYFGPVFLTSVIGYVSGSGISARLATQYDSNRIIVLGAVVTALACGIMLLCSTLFPRSVLALALPMVVYTIGLGLVLPHAMAIALQPFPNIAGTASALLGFIQMGVSASASAAAGLLLVDSPRPMVLIMTAASLLAVALCSRVYRHSITGRG